MKKRLYFICFLICILLFFNLPNLFSQDNSLEQAKKYEEENKFEDAIELYKVWLLSHTGDADFIQVLKYVIQLEDNSKNLITFLYKIDSLCKKIEEKLITAESLAQIEELHGNLSNARKYYLYIFNNGSGEQRLVSLLSAAQIYFQQGIFEKSAKALKIINQHSNKAEILAKAGVLLSSIYVISGEWEKAKMNYISLVKQYKTTEIYPIILLSYIEFLSFSGKNKEIKKILDVLKKYFSLLPEYYLALKLTGVLNVSRISYYPSPSYFMVYNKNNKDSNTTEIIEKKSETDTVYIQTGSFIFRENAEDMIAELLKNNFTGIIVEKKIHNKLYYKVLVKVDSTEPDKINNIMLKLKDAGFEGFLVTE